MPVSTNELQVAGAVPPPIEIIIRVRLSRVVGRYDRELCLLPVLEPGRKFHMLDIDLHPNRGPLGLGDLGHLWCVTRIARLSVLGAIDAFRHPPHTSTLLPLLYIR